MSYHCNFQIFYENLHEGTLPDDMTYEEFYDILPAVQHIEVFYNHMKQKKKPQNNTIATIGKLMDKIDEMIEYDEIKIMENKMKQLDVIDHQEYYKQLISNIRSTFDRVKQNGGLRFDESCEMGLYKFIIENKQ